MSILKLWKSKGQILEGIKNKLFTTDHIEEVAEARLEICKKCPEFDTKGDDCYVSGTQPCCRLCGCSMGLKAYAMSAECDLEKWKAVMTENEEDQLNEQLNDE